MSVISCKTKAINAEVEVSQKQRAEYYSSFIKPNNHTTKIYTLIDIDAIYKASSNFYLGTILYRNIETDSVYFMKGTSSKEIFNKISDINQSIPNELSNIDNNKEYSEIYRKLKKVLNDNELSQIVYSSEVKSKSAENKWDIYVIYSTSIEKKIREKTIPISNLNGLNELIILDLSINKADEE